MKREKTRTDLEEKRSREVKERRKAAEARYELLRAAYPVNAGMLHVIDFPGGRP